MMARASIRRASANGYRDKPVAPISSSSKPCSARATRGPVRHAADNRTCAPAVQWASTLPGVLALARRSPHALSQVRAFAAL